MHARTWFPIHRAMEPHDGCSNPPPQPASSAGLLQLPLPALALIYQHAKFSHNALLCVSREGRDTVLREARSISLYLEETGTPATRKPLVRLLSRACEGGAGGRLELELNAVALGRDHSSELLAELLLPAHQAPGWTSVGKLALRGSFGTQTPAKLVAAAFPALTHLHLEDVDLTATDLRHLSSCTQLSYVRTIRCSMVGTPAGGPGSSPLSTVISLRQLIVRDTPSALVKGVTQLTNLKLTVRQDTLGQLAAAVSGMSNLQQLELLGSNNGITMPALQLVLPSCATLRKLILHAGIDQQQFVVLLRHAPQLTHFTCYSLTLTEDMSRTACSLKELVVQTENDDLRLLPYLPLHSLERASFFRHTLQLPTANPELHFYFALGATPGVTPNLVRATLANLERCPAWQQSGTTVYINVMDSVGYDSSHVAEFDQVLEALSAAASKRVKLCLSTRWTWLQKSSLQKLGSALGERLVGLELRACQLGDDFWAAVWAHLPGLQQLDLCDTLSKVTDDALDGATLTSFCSHATHPLQLRLGYLMYLDLAKECEVWEQQMPLITVDIADA